jgi:hypothetical protein
MYQSKLKRLKLEIDSVLATNDLESWVEYEELVVEAFLSNQLQKGFQLLNNNISARFD